MERGQEDHNNRSTCSENGQVMMIQMESYNGASRPYNLRCYSASYAQTQIGPRDLKKEKSISKSWNFTVHPQLQRKKRVASYKMYCVKGKAKRSLRKGFKLLKDKYFQAVYDAW